MKKVFFLIIVIVLALVGWFFASPYYTVYQLKQAYDSHNAAAINAQIDFASVQADIKYQLNPILVKKMQTLTQSPIAQLVGVEVDENAVVEKLVNQAVDNGITPDTVTSIISTQGNLLTLNNHAKLLGGLTAVAMDKIKLNPETLASLLMAKNTDALNQVLLAQVKAADVVKGGGNNSDKPTAQYCGIDCFRVSTQVQGYPLTVEMARQGFSDWKIIKVKLPIN